MRPSFGRLTFNCPMPEAVVMCFCQPNILETEVIRLFAILALFAAQPLAAQSLPTPSDFESHSIEDNAFGTIGWHLDSVSLDEAGSLVVWLPGSGAMPYFQRYSDGSVGFSFPPELLAYRDHAHFMFVDKPGIPFSAEMEFDENRQRPVEIDNAVYRDGLTKDNLVGRAAIAIKAAQRELGDRITRLILIGGSEGAQYAFALAHEVEADRVVGWGGIALPQYYDLIIDYRLQAERGEISRDEAQANIEALYQSIAAIEANPYDTGERFEGEAYRRWSSFGPYSAIDDMLALDVPLLLVQGGDDRNAPILNSDYAKIAFLSAGKTNLTYWVYPNLDHFFQDTRANTSSSEVSKSRKVWGRIWDWAIH